MLNLSKTAHLIADAKKSNDGGNRGGSNREGAGLIGWPILSKPPSGRRALLVSPCLGEQRSSPKASRESRNPAERWLAMRKEKCAMWATRLFLRLGITQKLKKHLAIGRFGRQKHHFSTRNRRLLRGSVKK